MRPQNNLINIEPNEDGIYEYHYTTQEEPRVNRIEVIGPDGRKLVLNNVRVSFQDNGKTVKLFYSHN